MSESTSVERAAHAGSLILALRGWSRGCAALARREFARALGRKRLSPADMEAFTIACARARSAASVSTCVAALLIAAKPAVATAGDILRGGPAKPPATAPAAGAGQVAEQTDAARARAAAARRATDALARTTQALRAMRETQAAAANASRVAAAQVNVHNGLGAGGLAVAARVADDGSLWLNAAQPGQTVSGGKTQVTIVQNDAKAVLTWDSFHVGRDTELYFDQRAGGADAARWIALNRVTDTSSNPSQILGSIKAEGQVYIINPNGIVFGGASQVNVHTLVASGLDFKGATIAERDAAFRRGLAFDDNRAEYTLGIDAGSGRAVGDVTVKSGATLTANDSGSVFLVGSRVTNAGTISTPDGQTVLAAGERVWISKNWLNRSVDTERLDADLRGVRASVQAGGEAANEGLIEAERGNITITGKSVVNDGVLHASTSSKANGSVTLIAGDGAADDAIYWKAPTAFGDLTLGAGSLLAITADDSKGTALPSQFISSKIDLTAQTITVAENSTLYAPGARASLIAKTNDAAVTPATDGSYIDIRSGSLISLAGLVDVAVAMERNSVTGELRLDELKDAPLQRNGALRGKKVTVDSRRGTSFADLSGYYALVEQSAAESMTAGGTLKLDGGTLLARAGSQIDLSGGSVRYADGIVTTTRLLGADGRVYDITNANPNLVYKGVYDEYRRVETGYVQGANAGTLLVGPNGKLLSALPVDVTESANPYAGGLRPHFAAFDGTLTADTIVGPYQRNRNTGVATAQSGWQQLPATAALNLGYTDPQNLRYGRSVLIGDAPALPADITPDEAKNGAGTTALRLPSAFFDGKTFGRVTITSGIGGGDLTVPAGVVLNLGDYGTLEFKGVHADIAGRIVAPGGVISMTADWAPGFYATNGTGIDWTRLSAAERPWVKLADTASLSTAGTWLNELGGTVAGLVPVLDGGSVTVATVGDLTLASGSVVDVRGGAQITSRNKLVGGNGGSITISNDRLPEGTKGFASPPLDTSGNFDVAGADLRGFAIGKGGSLALGFSRPLTVADTLAASGGTGARETLTLTPEFFRQGGFASYSLGSSRDVLVTEGVTISPLALSYIVDAAGAETLRKIATGGDYASALPAGFLPVDLRPAASLTLANHLRNNEGNADESLANATAAKLTVSHGAGIEATAQSSIALLATGDLAMHGTAAVDGGSVKLATREGASLTLGDDARLSATGFVKTTPGAITVRSIVNGGTISLDGGKGTLVIAAGAHLDVSGVSGVADFKLTDGDILGDRLAYVARTAGGSAGTIAISHFSAGTVNGILSAHAGDAVASGGTIAIGAGLDLGADKAALVILNGPASAQANTVAVAISGLRDSGAANISLSAQRGIGFEQGVSLTAGRSLSFNTSLIGTLATEPNAGTVTLSAPYVAFGPFSPSLIESESPTAEAPRALSGKLRVSADLIDITQGLSLGGDALSGFEESRLVAKSDIRLASGLFDRAYLKSSGALILESAQTYVTTGNSQAGFTVKSDRSVAILGNGAPAPTPYAFGGILNVVAPDITQAGVLRAPLGTISLQAADSLLLAPGSVTSVSLDGLTVPYGALAGGFFGGNAETLAIPGAIPTKRIALNGKSVDIAAGATVDVSGGGDLLGYEFVAGNGGSRDILNDAGMFAVLPGYARAAAPVAQGKVGVDAINTPFADTRGLQSANLKAGDSVLLSGVNGLADGVYTLLPAKYALLPGGVAIKAVSSGYADKLDTVAMPDGAQLVSGHRTVAGTTIRDNAESRYLAMSAEVFRKYSEYTLYSFGKEAAAMSDKAGLPTPRLPADAGSLVLSASASLTLNGSGRFAAAAGGKLGELDIAAPKIAVVAPGAVAPDDTYLAIDAGQLTRFGVGSLLLGGTRTAAVTRHGADGQKTTGTGVTVTATEILVTNNAGAELIAPEIILAATDAVTLTDGASVRAEGVSSGSAETLLLDGNGALLRAATGARGAVLRAAADTATGTLSLGEGVSVSATGAITLDGSRSVENKPTAIIAAPQLGISASAVSLGDAPADAAGLVLRSETLARLGTVDDLLIHSSGTINLYGSTSLGALDRDGHPLASRIVLDAAGLVAHADASTTVNARTVAFTNGAGSAMAASSGATGTLAVNADKLSIESGNFGTAGFAETTVHARTVVASGKSAWSASGNVTLTTDVLTTANAADAAIVADGNLVLRAAGATPPVVTSVGGRLALTGATASIDTVIDMPSGSVEITATAGDLTFGAQGAVLTRGTHATFNGVTRTTRGGDIRLIAESGAITLGEAAVLDVSADTLGGDAGSITVRAPRGAIDLRGKLAGHGASPDAGGVFAFDATSLGDTTALLDGVAGGGFTAAQSYRVRAGDITIASGKTIKAHEVSLITDTGAITVDGGIDATGTARHRTGGAITLNSGTDLTLGASAKLDVSTGYTTTAAGYAAKAGTISLETKAGSIGTAAGSRMLATGGAEDGGTIRITARRDGADMRVTTLAGERTARSVTLIGRADIDAGATGMVTTTDTTAALSAAQSWMAGAPAIITRLGVSGVEIRPGVSFLATGDLTVTDAVDLSAARYSGAPGSLVFNAGGSLRINASVSDGFTGVTPTASLAEGRSWDLAFIAGGDIALAAGKLIRTGTGDITVVAGRDLALGDTRSVIYTAGTKTADNAAFVRGNRKGEYPVSGGDLRVTAGRDILAPRTQDFVSGWLFRYGYANASGGVATTVGAPTSWSVVFANFEQGLGTLGGGDMRVAAGRDIRDLAVALPTTGQDTARIGDDARARDISIRGGGNLVMSAGRDILGGMTMLGRGEADISAGGALADSGTALMRKTLNAGDGSADRYTERPLHALFALMDAKLNLQARGDARVEAIVDAMMISATTDNVGATASGYNAFFNSYTDRTSADIVSAAGNIAYYNNPWAGADLARSNTLRPINQRMSAPESLVSGQVVVSRDLLFTPGAFRFTAAQGGISLAQYFTDSGLNQAMRLAPSAAGTLELLARGDIVIETPVVLMDIAPEYRRDALAPLLGKRLSQVLDSENNATSGTNYGRGLTPLHAGDRAPVRIVSEAGSIVGKSGSDNQRVNLVLPKSLEMTVYADLKNIAVSVQHNQADDISILRAGRDIVVADLKVTGGGTLVVEAGRDLNLKTQFASGIQSLGNRGNLAGTFGGAALDSQSVPHLALPEKGADLDIVAGAAGADYAALAKSYLSPTNEYGVVRTYLPELRSFLLSRGEVAPAGDTALLAAFDRLPDATRRIFLRGVYFDELLATGIDATNPDSPRYGSYERGFRAGRTLFPEVQGISGDINLYGKPVNTQMGGDIRVINPRGDIRIDEITNLNSGSGLVTQKGGDARLMALGDIALGNSRVFTLQGGDILMWTSRGDITAGAGSKTRAVPPALTYVLDNDANLLLNATALQSGSGIGALDASRSGVQSRLDLIAPAGTVDAGDAGIRATGALNIAALRVVGADNISAGGAVSGVPTAAAPNVSASIAASASSAASTSAVSEESRRQQSSAAAGQQSPSLFTVEVLGYGGDDEEKPAAAGTTPNTVAAM